MLHWNDHYVNLKYIRFRNLTFCMFKMSNLPIWHSALSEEALCQSVGNLIDQSAILWGQNHNYANLKSIQLRNHYRLTNSLIDGLSDSWIYELCDWQMTQFMWLTHFTGYRLTDSLIDRHIPWFIDCVIDRVPNLQSVIDSFCNLQMDRFLNL